MSEVDTDILVIGGGLAGLVAALRSCRPEASAALPARVMVLEGARPGGLLQWGGRNAFHIVGPKYKFTDDDWALLMDEARTLGVAMVAEGVVSVRLDAEPKTIQTTAGRTLRAHAVIIASGAFPLKNAAQFKRRDGLVTTFGSATDIHMTVERLMKKTGRSTLLLIGPEPILELARLLASMQPWVLLDPPYVGPLPERTRLGRLDRIIGDPKIQGVAYHDEAGALHTLPCDTIYADFNAYMARTTATRYLEGSGVALDDGFVVTDRELATSVPGVFAAGDVTGGMFAVSKSIYEGNRAGLSALGWLHRTRYGFEPSFHPFAHGRFGAEIGRFHRVADVALGADASATPPWLEATVGSHRTRFELSPGLAPLADALTRVEGSFTAQDLVETLDQLTFPLLFELVRIGALGVGHAAPSAVPGT